MFVIHSPLKTGFIDLKMGNIFAQTPLHSNLMPNKKIQME